MNMISEIGKIRKLVKEYDNPDWGKETKTVAEVVEDCLDIIEFLCTKLEAMERSEYKEKRSATDYGGGWIACSEKLPDKNGYYIIQTQTNNIKIARYHYNTTREYMAFWIDHMKVENVVAWQPLPEPYQQN